MENTSDLVLARLEEMTEEARVANAFPVVTNERTNAKHKVYALIEGWFVISMFDVFAGVGFITAVPPSFFNGCVLDEPEAV